MTAIQITPRLAAQINVCDRCKVTGLTALMARGIHNRVCMHHGMLAAMSNGITTD